MACPCGMSTSGVHAMSTSGVHANLWHEHERCACQPSKPILPPSVRMAHNLWLVVCLATRTGHAAPPITQHRLTGMQPHALGHNGTFTSRHS
jgi:hypothetical protein